jgi:hypothetical protein
MGEMLPGLISTIIDMATTMSAGASSLTVLSFDDFLFALQVNFASATL